MYYFKFLFDAFLQAFIRKSLKNRGALVAMLSWKHFLRNILLSKKKKKIGV
jgi:hypothetical protein